MQLLKTFLILMLFSFKFISSPQSDEGVSYASMIKKYVFKTAQDIPKNQLSDEEVNETEESEEDSDDDLAEGFYLHDSYFLDFQAINFSQVGILTEEYTTQLLFAKQFFILYSNLRI
jgi:hypothetical protein